MTFLKFYIGEPNSCSVVSQLTALNDHITEYVCSSSASTTIQDRSNTCFLPVGLNLNASLSHTWNHHTPASQEALSPSLCLSSCLSVCLSPTDFWQSPSFYSGLFTVGADLLLHSYSQSVLAGPDVMWCCITQIFIMERLFSVRTTLTSKQLYQMLVGRFST